MDTAHIYQRKNNVYVHVSGDEECILERTTIACYVVLLGTREETHCDVAAL